MPPLRDAPATRWIRALLGDARFALRYFARHKGTTAIVVAVLALGTGANSLIFSTFQAHFLRPAPAVPTYRDQARIWAQERPTRGARWRERGFSGPELAALAARREIFRDVAGWTEDEVVLDTRDSTGARAMNVQFVTPNYFRAIGVTLAAGQGFRRSADGAADDTPDMAAIMSYAFAEQLYGNAAAAIGRRLLVNETPVHVVGVAPPRFQGALRNMNDAVLWLPVSARADIARLSPRWLADDAALSLFAHLAPGASRDRATALARQVVAHALPDSAARVGMARTADVLAMSAPPPGEAGNELLIGITMIMTVGALILLVGWMNVSSIMVAAAVGRRHEIAVRLSLGASRPRLLRQLVTESTLLALAGSTIGVTLAYWLLVYQQHTEVDGVNLMPDLGTFAFVLGMAMTTGILFGLSPALHAIGGGVATALRDARTGSHHRSRLQRGFVVAQIALSQPLLVLLGTILSLVVAQYHPTAPTLSSHVVAVHARPLDALGGRATVDSLVSHIAARPEVLGAVPDAAAFAVRGLVAPDRHAPNARADSAPTIVHVEGTAPGWFALMDIPLLLGRDVTLADTAGAERAVVIGSDLARALWGNANPIGRRLASPALAGLEQDSIAMTVVGVYDATASAPTMTWNGAAASGTPTPRIYTAHGKQWQHDRVLVRTRGPAAAFVPALQRFVRAQAPTLPVTSMLTLAQEDERAYQDTLQMASLAGAGGALALLLASLGLYGVVSLAVRQRTREIGIRIAVGARPMEVARTFLASGVRASLVALALGLPLSVAALKVGMAQGLVIAPEVNPYLIGIVIAPVLLAVASAATWVPARRAAHVDPARTLRVE